MAEDHSPELDNLTAEEASRIIHSHRKVRYGKFYVIPKLSGFNGVLGRSIKSMGIVRSSPPIFISRRTKHEHQSSVHTIAKA